MRTTTVDIDEELLEARLDDSQASTISPNCWKAGLRVGSAD